MKKMLLLLFCGMTMMYACKTKKIDVPSPFLNVSDGNAVSDHITVTNGSKKSGNLPAPSEFPDAPILESPSGNIPALIGRKFTFSPSVSFSSTDVKGVYFQVVGSDDYYDVSIKVNQRIAAHRSAKVNADTMSVVEIELPPNITPGTFCIDYSVYDASSQVSNVVRVCVTVYQIGGDNADFLNGTWKIVSYEDDSGVYDYSSYTEGFQSYKYCESADSTYYVYQCGPNPEDTCSYYFHDFIADSVYISGTFSEINNVVFSSNGGLSNQYSYTSSYSPSTYTYSLCGGTITYANESYSDNISGGWSYVDATKKLILLFDESEYGYAEPYSVEFDVVSVNGSTMILKDSVFGERYTFQKQ